MKQLVFTSDVFRSHAFNLNSVAENRNWLNGLFHDLFAEAGYSIRQFGPMSEGGTFDLRRYRHEIGLPSSAQGWATAVATRVPDRAIGFFDDLLRASAVIGWGLPPSLINLLERHEVPFIDVEIDPVRFAEDLYFRMRTNSPHIARVLASHDVGNDKLRASVSAIRGYAARRSSDVTAAGQSLALFVGQTSVDLALVESGKLATPSDYLDTIRSVAQSVDVLLVKPHPGQRDFSHLAQILDDIPNAHLCRSNTYRILCDIKLKHVVGLSSSVLSEAALFQVPTTQLITCDRDASPLVPGLGRRWFRVPSSIVLDRGLPKAIGGRTFLRHLALPRRKKALKGFNLRMSLGGGWGLDEFYSSQSLPLDMPDEAPRAHCSQQIGTLDLAPYLTDGWSSQEPWGVWSVGHRHTIRARLADFDEGANVTATLHMGAFVTREHPEQQVKITVDGTLAYDLHFRWNEQEEACITVPVSSSAMEIVIETPDAASPAALGIGADERLLGIRMISIAFAADVNAVAPHTTASCCNDNAVTDRMSAPTSAA